MNHRSELKVIVDLIVVQTFTTNDIQSPADSVPAGIHAALAQLHSPIAGEEIRDRSPHLLIEVVAIVVLQVQYVCFVPELLRAASELDPSLLQSLEVRGTGRAVGRGGQIGVRHRSRRRIAAVK